MKRELLCATCGERSIKEHHGLIRHFTFPDSPPEYVRHVRGTCKVSRPTSDMKIDGQAIPWGPGPCLCDYCSAEIPKDAPAVARTMGMTSEGVDDYTPWESTYIEELF